MVLTGGRKLRPLIIGMMPRDLDLLRELARACRLTPEGYCREVLEVWLAERRTHGNLGDRGCMLCPVPHAWNTATYSGDSLSRWRSRADRLSILPVDDVGEEDVRRGLHRSLRRSVRGRHPRKPSEALEADRPTGRADKGQKKTSKKGGLSGRD